MALSRGFRDSVFLFSAIRATRLLPCLGGSVPHWTLQPFLDTLPDGRISQVRFETLACLPWAFPAWRGLSAGSHTPRLRQFALSLAPPHAPAHHRFCARPPR